MSQGPLHCLLPYHSEKLHRVSKKTVQNHFCQNVVKFPPTVKIFGTKMANRRINLCELHSFSTSPIALGLTVNLVPDTAIGQQLLSNSS